MATSAFNSTTKRTSIGGGTPSSGEYSSPSTNRNPSVHRRSRSVSRFSHRFPPESTVGGSSELPARKGKFVNTVRGSGFPEISLDDLAIELFSSSELAGRGRISDLWTPGTSSQRRGRSVSRHRSRVGGGGGGGDGDALSCRRAANGSARRRSISAVRYQASDSEDDVYPENSARTSKHTGFSGGRKQKSLTKNPIAVNQCGGSQKCSSQKDLLKLHDDYSSHSSVLTEDEALEFPSGTHHLQTAIQAIKSQKKIGLPSSYGLKRTLHGTMQRELRNVVEIKQELKEAKNNQDSSELISKGGIQVKDSDVLQAVSTIRKGYATILEQSELRKQQLLAEMMLEEQRGKELKRIVGTLVPDRETPAAKRLSRARKRINDKKKMPEQLTEEAEKIIDDFMSSFDDTDISSIDGERSETSSIFGVTTRPRDDWMPCGARQNFTSPLRSDTLPALPVEMDGVVLPWLQWEAGDDALPTPCQSNILQEESEIIPQDKLEEIGSGQEQERSTHSKSSRGSWSPRVAAGDNCSVVLDMTISKTVESSNYRRHILVNVPRRSRAVDMDDHLKNPSNLLEDFLVERWKNREMIARGGILLCHGSLGVIL